MSSPRRTFTATVIMEADFVGDDASKYEQNFLEHLTDEVRRAAESISLRSVKAVRVHYCGGGIVHPAE